MNHSKTAKIGTLTGLAIVVANMIGTGVFTSLGFQLQVVNHPMAILTLWIVGGLLALSGAFSYIEIATQIKKSGGEYIFLSEIYSPLVGYLAGWVSLTVGFAAPVALAAIAVVSYFPFWELPPVTTSIILVAVVTYIHSLSLRFSSIFQNISTLLKVLLIALLIMMGLWMSPSSEISMSGSYYMQEVLSSSFAIALIYVSYSYSGWNAAVYIIEEFADPKRSLIVALIGGTALVTLLYTALQYVFLRHVAVTELVGQINVGAIVAQKILGADMGHLFSLAISLLLISGISAMVWVGPRVTSSMANDYKIWRFFQSQGNEIPVRALWFQCAVTTLLLLTGTFEQILIYCGFLLSVSSLLTVLGVFILRRRSDYGLDRDHLFQSPLFPFFQIVYIFFSLGMIIFVFVDRPLEASLGLSQLMLGALTWYLDKRIDATKAIS